MNGAEVKAYSRAKDGGTALTPHFKVLEFACHDGSDTVFVSPALAKNGGAAYSQHKYGMAADIAISGVKPEAVAAYAEKLLPTSGGIGVYKSFCHVDVRETKSRWQG